MGEANPWGTADRPEPDARDKEIRSFRREERDLMVEEEKTRESTEEQFEKLVTEVTSKIVAENHGSEAHRDGKTCEQRCNYGSRCRWMEDNLPYWRKCRVCHICGQNRDYKVTPMAKRIRNEEHKKKKIIEQGND